MKTRLTLRLEQDLIEGAKAYAKRHDTSLSTLVERHFQVLATQQKSVEISPFIASLRGALPDDTNKAEYHAHLEDKFK